VRLNRLAKRPKNLGSPFLRIKAANLPQRLFLVFQEQEEPVMALRLVHFFFLGTYTKS